MSVAADRDAVTSVNGPWDHLGVNTWALCAEFVEKVLSEAQAEAARRHPERPAPKVDHAAIWRAGDGAPTDEVAIGRIVLAASGVARRIRAADGVVVPPYATAVGADAGSAVAPQRAMPRGAGAPAPTEAAPMAEPLVAPVAQPVVAPAAEPAAEPVPTAAAVTRAVPIMVGYPPAERLAPPVGVPMPEPAPAAAEPEQRSAIRVHSASFTAFTWIRNVGAVMLLFVVWQLWGTAISQHQAQNQLQAQFEAAVRAHHATAQQGGKATLVPASTFVPSGGEGSVVARIQIPKIGVDQYVVEGTTESDLAKGPGHYVGTAMPGQAGNVAIAGHRTTHGAPFNRLGQLAPGDSIVVTSTSGQNLTYVVTGPPRPSRPATSPC